MEDLSVTLGQEGQLPGHEPVTPPQISIDPDVIGSVMLGGTELPRVEVQADDNTQPATEAWYNGKKALPGTILVK